MVQMFIVLENLGPTEMGFENLGPTEIGLENLRPTEMGLENLGRIETVITQSLSLFKGVATGMTQLPME